MSSRSLNKVMLIGNLTRDVDLRYTPSGDAVCTICMATNRYWVTASGEKKEETEFHRVVVWHKLAELCGQLLVKGSKLFVEGRLANRKFMNKENVEVTSTEVIAEEMIVLNSKKVTEQEVT